MLAQPCVYLGGELGLGLGEVVRPCATAQPGAAPPALLLYLWFWPGPARALLPAASPPDQEPRCEPQEGLGLLVRKITEVGTIY